MSDPFILLLTIAFLAASFFASLRAKRAFEAAVKRSFEQLTFETPAGRVTGASLRVVKVVTWRTGNDSSPSSDLFWYCVGDGPSYFVAMGHVRSRFATMPVDWVIRPLTEERMRGALVGDGKACALAFGSAVEG